MRRPLDDDEDQGDEVPTVVRDPGRFARCMPDWRVNAGNWRSLPDSPIPYPTWDTQADPLRRATTCSTVLSDHPKLRRRCAGSAHYARLRSWTVARRSHGTVRGTTRRITPAQQVPSVRRPVQSVQLVRVMHGAVVLIIRRSWVRAPPAPPAVLISAPAVLRQMVLRSSGSCEATAYGHEYCEGTAADAVAKRRQRMFYPFGHRVRGHYVGRRNSLRPSAPPVRAVSAGSSGAIYAYRRVGQRWRSGGSCESGLVASPAGSEVVTVRLSHRARPAGQLI